MSNAERKGAPSTDVAEHGEVPAARMPTQPDGSDSLSGESSGHFTSAVAAPASSRKVPVTRLRQPTLVGVAPPAPPDKVASTKTRSPVLVRTEPQYDDETATRVAVEKRLLQAIVAQGRKQLEESDAEPVTGDIEVDTEIVTAPRIVSVADDTEKRAVDLNEIYQGGEHATLKRRLLGDAEAEAAAIASAPPRVSADEAPSTEREPGAEPSQDDISRLTSSVLDASREAMGSPAEPPAHRPRSSSMRIEAQRGPAPISEKVTVGAAVIRSEDVPQPARGPDGALLPIETPSAPMPAQPLFLREPATPAPLSPAPLPTPIPTHRGRKIVAFVCLGLFGIGIAAYAKRGVVQPWVSRHLGRSGEPAAQVEPAQTKAAPAPTEAPTTPPVASPPAASHATAPAVAPSTTASTRARPPKVTAAPKPTRRPSASSR